MAGKLRVLDRGTDMVLAEHYTPVHHGRLTAATLETVTFDRPHRIGFRLARGPVPHTPWPVTRSTGKAHSPPADAVAGYVIELARGSAVWLFEFFAAALAGSCLAGLVIYRAGDTGPANGPDGEREGRSQVIS